MIEPLNKDSILTFFEAHKDELGKLGVRSIGLFGSFVRNEQTSKSDIDLLVDYKKGEKKLQKLYGLDLLPRNGFRTRSGASHYGVLK